MRIENDIRRFVHMTFQQCKLATGSGSYLAALSKLRLLFGSRFPRCLTEVVTSAAITITEVFIIITAASIITAITVTTITEAAGGGGEGADLTRESSQLDRSIGPFGLQVAIQYVRKRFMGYTYLILISWVARLTKIVKLCRGLSMPEQVSIRTIMIFLGVGKYLANNLLYPKIIYS